MSTQLGGQPVYILTEGSSRTSGRDAQSLNITAAEGSCPTQSGVRWVQKEWIRCLSTPWEKLSITNDGVTILKEMDIEHPAAKMMVEVAQDTGPRGR